MNEPAHVDLWVMQEPAEYPPAMTRQLEALLAADERSRWQRFSRPEDQRRYLLGRGLLRTVLASCAGVSPEALQLAVSPFGKPGLPSTCPEIHFNLSHTCGKAVLAVSRIAPVGVDVEPLDREVKLAELSARYFSREEQAELQGLPVAEMRRRFFAIWTCKEAYLKAIGLGLRIPLDSFSVRNPATCPAIVRHDPAVAGREVACRQWYPEERYSVALAVCIPQDRPLAVHWHHWAP
jgi:4'-phosphopantetheinyl transferase